MNLSTIELWHPDSKVRLFDKAASMLLASSRPENAGEGSLIGQCRHRVDGNMTASLGDHCELPLGLKVNEDVTKNRHPSRVKHILET